MTELLSRETCNHRFYEANSYYDLDPIPTKYYSTLEIPDEEWKARQEAIKLIRDLENKWIDNSAKYMV